MVVSHNLPALSTYLNIKRNDRLLAATTQRLSTGYRINSAKDDAAGLAIVNKLTYQIDGLNQASLNATNGISMIQTADGALTEVHNMLQRMRELAVQAANDTNMKEDRQKIQAEVDELVAEISAIADRTEFNKIKLLNGEADRITEIQGMYKNVIDTSAMPPMSYPGIPDVPINNIANILYVSDKVSAGSYSFEIESPEITKIMIANQEGIINEVTGKADPLIEIDVYKWNITAIFTNEQGETFNNLFNPVELVYEDNPHKINASQVIITGPGGQEIKLSVDPHELLKLARTEYDTPPLPGVAPDPNDIARSDYPVTIKTEVKSYGPIKLQIGPNHNMAISIQIPRITSEIMGFVEYRDGKEVPILDYVNGYLDEMEYVQKKDIHNKPVFEDDGVTPVMVLDRKPRDTHSLSLIGGGSGFVDNAIAFVSAVRARLGAYQNRMESTVLSLDTAAENTEASRSRIRDSDIAKEMTANAQQNVMYQAGLAILGQANQRPQQIISLLQ